MKNTILYSFILFLCIVECKYVSAQKIIKVGTGEYFTSYLTDEGKVYAVTGNGRTYNTLRIPVDNIVDVQGAQYTNIALNDSGEVFILGRHTNGKLFATPVKKDESGNPFRKNEKVYGWYQSYLTIKNGEVWIWGQDLLNINRGKNMEVPQRLFNPPGKKIRKLVPLTMDIHSLMALATDGTVWRYQRSALPEKIKINGIAKNIAGIGAGCYVVETNNDLLAWGYLGSYLGVKDMGTIPVSIKSKWQAAGCVWPIKELVGNYNTLHIIDAKDHLFGAGENVQGEVGNGKQFHSWKDYPTPYAWNWNHGQMVQAPVQIMGEFKNLCTSTTITFYHYVQDMGGNWYSWGRNKSRSLGNGLTLSMEDELRYPNACVVPAPELVEPLLVTWKVMPPFDVNAPKKPMANAGTDQFIKSTSTILYGQYSSVDGSKIRQYAWKQTEGKKVIIEKPSSANTRISGLLPGVYSFSLHVIADNGLSDEVDVKVMVK